MATAKAEYEIRIPGDGFEYLAWDGEPPADLPTGWAICARRAATDPPEPGGWFEYTMPRVEYDAVFGPDSTARREIRPRALMWKPHVADNRGG